MQKIQILFPNPLMGRVKAVATEEDRPMSETSPEKPRQRLKLPTFRGGKILVPSEQLKDAIYDDEPL